MVEWRGSLGCISSVSVIVYQMFARRYQDRWRYSSQQVLYIVYRYSKCLIDALPNLIFYGLNAFRLVMKPFLRCLDNPQLVNTPRTSPAQVSCPAHVSTSPDLAAPTRDRSYQRPRRSFSCLPSAPLPLRR